MGMSLSGWPKSVGVVVFPASPNRYPGSLLALHSDGAGGGYVAWGDFADDGGGLTGSLWMTRVLSPELVGVPPAARPGALSLSAPRPNPSRGSLMLDVTLPDDSVARVELLDVAGRIVRGQSVQGTGAHAVSFDGLGRLAPGLYFARVSHASGERATRMVLTR